MNIYPNVDYWQMLTKIRHILGADADEEEILVEYALLCVKNKRSSMAREILIDLLGEAPINNFRIHKSPQQQYFVQSDNFDVAIPEARCANPSVVYAYSKLLLASGKVENQIAGYVHLLRLLGNQKVSGPFLDKVIVKILRCIDYFSNRQNVYQIQDDVQYKSLVNQSVTNVIESYSASVTSDVLDPSEVTTSSTYSRSDYTNVAPDKNMLVGMVVSDITCQLGHPPPPGSPNCPLSGQLVGSLFEQSKAEFWLPVTPQLLSYAALGARVHQPDPALAVRLQLRAGASAGRRRVVLHRRRGAAGVREDDRHLAAEQRAGRGPAAGVQPGARAHRPVAARDQLRRPAVLHPAAEPGRRPAEPPALLRRLRGALPAAGRGGGRGGAGLPDDAAHQPRLGRLQADARLQVALAAPGRQEPAHRRVVQCMGRDFRADRAGPAAGVLPAAQPAEFGDPAARGPVSAAPGKIASDGEVYCYLLKGKEGLRLADCQVHAYPVFPLTNASGLIFWVPNTNSLQKLKQNDYDMQIQPDSLRRALFQLSQNSEDFISARATGHILGLGDRHPGNILLNEGREVVHIDYGDCFEIAQQREKYPEKTVFRLTAMVEAAAPGSSRATSGRCWASARNRSSYRTLQGHLVAPKFAVQSATNVENLAQAYFGWAPFW